MEFLRADYTEVLVPSPIVPLIQFADAVESISSTRLDMVLDDVPEGLANRLCDFDEIVSWYGSNRPEFRHAMTAVNPNCTFFQALPDSAWTGHACDFFLSQVSAPTGRLPQICVDSKSACQQVIIHPYSGSESKNWPLPKFHEIARRLPNAEFADGKFENLLHLAQWMKGAHAYLGNDSGISHLAAAIGVPSVVLFGPTHPRTWAPRGDSVRILRHQPIGELPVEAVLQALLDMGCQIEDWKAAGRVTSAVS